jgi:hypothetical protein
VNDVLRESIPNATMRAIAEVGHQVLKDIEDYGLDVNDPATFARLVRAIKARSEEKAPRSGLTYPPIKPEPVVIRGYAPSSMVYYINLFGAAVKIGYSANVPHRRRQLRVEPWDVMAVEPGGYTLESRRHQQFKEARCSNYEHFNRTPELLAHIEHLRKTVGKPDEVLRSVGLNLY